MTGDTAPAPSIALMKTQAKALRDAATPSARPTHSQALEQVARRHGFANWNVACAKARAGVDAARLRIGERVRGRYLGHAFDADVRGLVALAADRYRVTLAFDEPIDVVRFEGFSNRRRRVSAVIDRHGASRARLSCGVPHLTIDAD